MLSSLTRAVWECETLPKILRNNFRLRKVALTGIVNRERVNIDRRPSFASPLYNPRWFKEDRVDLLQDEVNRLSFGTIITTTKDGILASHVPMLIDSTRGEFGTLFGHVARGNAQWRDSTISGQGLAVFLG